VDIDDLGFEAHENPKVALRGEASVRPAHLIADGSATRVLTASPGPDAWAAPTAAGISVVVGCGGSI